MMMDQPLASSDCLTDSPSIVAERLGGQPDSPSEHVAGNHSVQSITITRRVSEGFTPPSLADASGDENLPLSDAE